MSKNRSANVRAAEVCASFANASAANSLTEQTSLNAKVDKNGALFCAPARKILVDATVFGAADIFPAGTLVCCTSEKTICKPKSGSSVSYEHVFSSPTFLFCLKNGSLIVSQSDDQTAIYRSKTWSKVADFGFDSMALFNERVFGADGSNVVRFSACDDPTDFSGTITFPCRIYAVTVCRDELFAVGDDIFRIEFDDETPKTKVAAVCSDVGKIFGKTVRSVANVIFFLSTAGLFYYKNGAIKQIALNVETSSADSQACASTTADRYWVSFAPAGKTSPEIVAEIDAATFAPVCYHEISTDYLSGGDRLIFNVNSRPCTFADGNTNFVWKSSPYDFGSQSKKQLRNIFVRTSAALDVTLTTDEKTQTFAFDGSDALQLRRIRGSFRSLSAELRSTGGATVSQFGVTAEVPTN